jgi:Tfp pilus assembly protein PilN
MRAVNLVPSDQRRGAGGLAGRSGGVVYVLTGGLAVLVALGVVYALAVHSVASRTTDLASVTRQVAVVNAESQALQPYVQVAGVTTEKVHEVTSLAESRFNWPSAMQQLALALPGDVTFTSFTATSNAGAPASTTASTTTTPATGSGTSSGSAASSGSGATFSLIGCASTQREVAEVLTNLFQVPGVSNVQLVGTVESAPPKKNKLSRQAALKAALSAGGACPLVTFTVSLTYGSYTVPNTKAPKASPGGAQTVSSSSGRRTKVVQTAASHHSAGAAK